MGKERERFWLPIWFDEATKVVLGVVAVVGAGGAVTIYFVFPIIVQTLNSLATPGTADSAIQLAAWAFAGGWGLSICLVLIMIYVVYWSSDRVKKAQAGLERKIKIGVASRELHSLLLSVRTTASGVIDMLTDKHVEYDYYESFRENVVKQLKARLTKIDQLSHGKRDAFEVMTSTRKGLILGRYIQRLLDSLSTDLYAEANRPCKSATDWLSQAEDIRTRASTLIIRTNRLIQVCLELDPSRPAWESQKIRGGGPFDGRGLEEQGQIVR